MQASRESGYVSAIYLAATPTETPSARQRVELEAGRGIVGDRYYNGIGTFSAKLANNPKRELTLIEAEQVELFQQEVGATLAEGELRRNVVTRGVQLNELAGKEFSLGGLRFRGVDLCEPCAYLARTVDSRVLPHLVGRCGLRAQILTSGTLEVGATFAVE